MADSSENQASGLGLELVGGNGASQHSQPPLRPPNRCLAQGCPEDFLGKFPTQPTGEGGRAGVFTLRCAGMGPALPRDRLRGRPLPGDTVATLLLSTRTPAVAEFTGPAV